MSELWRDALFASDGTEPSPPVPKGSGDDRGDAPIPSVPMPPIPPFGTTREEIAATLSREDPDGLADHHPVAAPASPPAVPGPRAAQATATKPGPPDPQPPGPSSAGGPARPTRPVISAAPLPDQGPPRRFGALGFARRVVPVSGLRPGQRGEPDRQAGGPSGGLQVRTLSDGGATVFFTIMSIAIVVLLYLMVSGIVAAFARLIP